MTRKLKLFAKSEINEEEHFSPEFNMYESSVAPDTISIVVKRGPGLRLNKEQVIEVSEWLNEWRNEHA